MASKEYNPKDGSRWTPVLVAIIAAAVGSLGTVSIYLGTPIGQEIARPDPFTGAQASSLIADIRRIEDNINQHITQHPDKLNQFDRRITTLEVQFDQIIANQARILDKLDGR